MVTNKKTVPGILRISVDVFFFECAVSVCSSMMRTPSTTTKRISVLYAQMCRYIVLIQFFYFGGQQVVFDAAMAYNSCSTGMVEKEKKNTIGSINNAAIPRKPAGRQQTGVRTQCRCSL